MSSAERAERLAEEQLRGPALLSRVRARVVKNYRTGRNSVSSQLQAAKRDVWLLTREIERLVRADEVERETRSAQERCDAVGEAARRRSGVDL